MKARSLFLSLIVILVLPAFEPVAAHDSPADPADDPNIRVTLTIGDSKTGSGFRERNYTTLGRPHQKTELLMGWRTPIPSKRKELTAVGESPVIAYTYQNVGVTAHVELDMVGDRILMKMQVEVSGPKEGAGEAARNDAPPIIGTFQQHVVVLLTAGKAMRIAEVPDHEGGSLYLQVTAEIVD